MTRAQKLVLILLAFADLAVIGGLAFVVVRSMRSDLPPTPAAALELSPCSSALLTALEELGENARVDWSGDKDSLIVLTFAPTTRRAGAEASPTPQLVWTVLDALSPALLDTCDVPSTVTLLLSANDSAGTHRYALAMTGETLAGWVQGSVSDAELASSARYRETHTDLP